MGRCGPPVGVGSFRHSVATVHSGGAPCAAPTIACSRQRACIRPARSVAAEGIGRVQSRGLAPHLPGPERAAEEHTGPAPPTKSRCRCGRGEPGPGADVAGVSHLATSAHDLISSCACLTFGAAYLRIGPGADWAHPCTRTGLTPAPGLGSPLPHLAMQTRSPHASRSTSFRSKSPTVRPRAFQVGVPPPSGRVTPKRTAPRRQAPSTSPRICRGANAEKDESDSFPRLVSRGDALRRCRTHLGL